MVILMNTSRGFVSLSLILLLVLVLGGAGWYVSTRSSNPQQTKGGDTMAPPIEDRESTTYTNTAFGFSIQYDPNSMRLGDNTRYQPAESGMQSIGVTFTSADDSAQGDVLVAASSRSDDVEKCLTIPPPDEATYRGTGTTTINGIPFLSYTYEYKGEIMGAIESGGGVQYKTLYAGVCYAILNAWKSPAPKPMAKPSQPSKSQVQAGRAALEAKLSPVVQSFRFTK